MSEPRSRRPRRAVVAIVTAMDEYQAQLMRAAQRVLAQRSIPLVVHCEGPAARGADSPLLVGLLERGEPLGVLSLNAMDVRSHQKLLALLERVGVPVVHVGLDEPGHPSVRGESEAAMRALMAEVLDVRGARTVALVRGIAHHPDSMARERIVRAELERRHLPLDGALVVTGNFTPETTYEQMRRLLEVRRDLDAVVALNDRSAVAAIDALTDMGLRVPEDVAVTGFDNDPNAAHWPGLTTVDQSFDQQGEAAAQLLLDLIDERGDPTRVVVPASVIVRGSTAARGTPAVTDMATAIEMARLEKQQISAQDGIVALSHALDHCWTVEDIVAALGTHLPRLGVDRAFLALHERSYGDAAEEGLTVRVDEDRVQLVLDHRPDASTTTTTVAYPAYELLPPDLANELDRGPLIIQPLAVLDRPFGFILFEQTGGPVRLTELMRIDLSRALDGVLTTQEIRAHATRLERVVARRTRELQTEVVTRRRAERELQAANLVLQRSAMLDGLTQIANRTAFAQHLERHWHVEPGGGLSLALLMVDVDAFKPYNDHYGHLLGDDALRIVASCLQQAAWGAEDLACRYGGEEFAVVLPDSGVDAAVAVAQRFQGLLAAAAIDHIHSPVGGVLTTSIGIAVVQPRPGDHPDTLLARADQALYRAKALGRDRIHIAEDDPGDREGHGADTAVTLPTTRTRRPRVHGPPGAPHRRRGARGAGA